MEEEYLYLPEAQNEKYWDLDTDNWLESLGAIKNVNIFVGANNSGKSRLMRMLLCKDKSNPIFFTTKNFINELSSLYSKLDNLEIIKGNKLELRAPITESNISGLQQAIHKQIENFKSSSQHKVDLKGFDLSRLQQAINNIQIEFGLSKLQEEFKTLKNNLEKVSHSFIDYKIYIPILRSALTFHTNDFGKSASITTDDFYKKTIWQLYNFPSKIKKQEEIEVFTGRSLYDDIKKSQNSKVTSDDRKKLQKFTEFIESIFFNNKKISFTAEQDTYYITIYFEETGEERNIQDLGDGIQTIIILTYKIFMANEGAWIFIEEPELNLHPAYQRIFLELITQNKDIKDKNLKIFFTTHSNHLLDITITQNSNVSIFVFERGERNGENVSLVRNVSATDLQTLDTLGVHNSSVFMANCSIWVEGITDRIYIRNYLKAYIKYCKDNSNEAQDFEKEYKEDLHFAFFEYAGSNLEHYNFDDSETENIQAKFIANRVFVIADRDENKERKHTKFKTQLKHNYQVLKVKEIENLLKGSFLKEKLPKLFSSIKASDISAIDFKEQEYRNTFLRYYLIKKLQGLENLPAELKLEFKKAKDSKIKQEKQETFSQYYKQKLANLTDNITWDEMSKEAQELTKKIYDFIRTNNQTKA